MEGHRSPVIPRLGRLHAMSCTEGHFCLRFIRRSAGLDVPVSPPPGRPTHVETLVPALCNDQRPTVLQTVVQTIYTRPALVAEERVERSYLRV